MRRVFLYLASVLITLASVPAGAQTAPLDTVREVVRQKVRIDAKAAYETARKKHMQWHKAQNDPWEWDVFELITGPDTGAYIITSGNHQWKEMEDWTAKHEPADSADAAAAMGFAITGSQRSYWTQLNSISRLPPQGERLALATVTYYRVKPGSDLAVRAAIAKVNAASRCRQVSHCSPSGTSWRTAATGRPTPCSRRAPDSATWHRIRDYSKSSQRSWAKRTRRILSLRSSRT